MKNLLTTLSCFIVFSFVSVGQELTTTQTIKGKIIDKVSQYPLIGAAVYVVDTDPRIQAVSDLDGYYKLQDVPLGRHDVVVSYMGYKNAVRHNVLVTVGKEVVINFELDEMVFQTEEVVISLKKDKSKTNNQNTTVSARTFDVQETARYAGSRNDPARMAMNYAGVSTGSDARNDIIIRGNSPLGVQYRLDGVVIPNPNHFGSLGTTGGPVSMLNNNLLDKSDFMTGAFPSEYGNVLAGVFDLRLREGNHEKREYLGQVGFNGLELGAEGPFSKNSRASYLVNYRYSTLEIFDALGISFGTSAIPQYQDLSFKVVVPTEKHGKFSAFGLGGISYIELLGSELDQDDIFGETNEDVYFGSNIGVAGLSHLFFHNDKTFSRTTVTVSGITNRIAVDSLTFSPDFSEVIDKTPSYGNGFDQVKYSLNYVFNKKFDSKNSITAGLIEDIYRFNFKDSTLLGGDFYLPLTNTEGTTLLSQVYAHWQHRFTDHLLINSGLHYQQLALNGSQALEPRLGLKYTFHKSHNLSLGLGMHSQVQPFQTYFSETEIDRANEIYVKTNEDLGFTRSAHSVVAYDWSINNDFRLKVETYFQRIYNAPVQIAPSTYSMLNAGADFGIADSDSLVNKGTGYNYGFELTLEKFFSKTYYFLVTTSLFESKYRGSDDVLRNTAFNGNYTFNALVGKEIAISGRSVLAIDLKATLAGGKRYIPFDVDASIAAGETVFDFDNAWDPQFDSYFRTDVKIGYRINGKKATQEWVLDIQNVTNRQNVFDQSFNASTGQVRTNYQLGLFPIFQYKILF